MPAATGEISPDPLPEQLSEEPVNYTVRAQSRYDVQKWQEARFGMSVHEPAVCSLQSVKSTEALVSCAIRDSNNLYLQAIYLLISDYGTDTPYEQSSFSCYPEAAVRQSEGALLETVCTKDRGRCCCWMWLPGGEDTSPQRSLMRSTIVGRITHSSCNLGQQLRYGGMSMAAGVNPLAQNERTAVVSRMEFDFTIPKRDEARPIQFEMKVDISYEEECDPVKNGPEAEAACKERMRAELVKLLGAPPEMIEVLQVRPG
uniref:Uncharacterized protein n=1 Tax=Pyrodinium bahamense TaxID=73915 RepID=A0A7S0B8E8_9DINO|mmetsp:Transcript_54412/g.150946  ORF Transcript_54412/g.150946 Transcript_54412/m.150946 type:complete len:258 (+) Transcript_54412:13-786(+)